MSEPVIDRPLGPQLEDLSGFVRYQDALKFRRQVQEVLERQRAYFKARRATGTDQEEVRALLARSIEAEHALRQELGRPFLPLDRRELDVELTSNREPDHVLFPDTNGYDGVTVADLERLGYVVIAKPSVRP